MPMPVNFFIKKLCQVAINKLPTTICSESTSPTFIKFDSAGSMISNVSIFKLVGAVSYQISNLLTKMV